MEENIKYINQLIQEIETEEDELIVKEGFTIDIGLSIKDYCKLKELIATKNILIMLKNRMQGVDDEKNN